jgi:hypothetical protein
VFNSLSVLQQHQLVAVVMAFDSTPLPGAVLFSVLFKDTWLLGSLRVDPGNIRSHSCKVVEKGEATGLGHLAAPPAHRSERMGHVFTPLSERESFLEWWWSKSWQGSAHFVFQRLDTSIH